MGSLQLMLLCFLLLTVAPRSNTAMPSGSCAERTPDSSTSKAKVTVYLCRGCKRSVCEKNDYTAYEKIAETQQKVFACGTLHLETNETRIRLCYPPTSVLDGVLAIFWEKGDGIGSSCGTVNSEASSENGTDDIMETCCEAEINVEKNNDHLKCYTKVVDSKDIKSNTDFPDEENNLAENFQSVIDEQLSSSVIITPVLVTIVVCGAALAVYCVRRRRNGREPIIIYQFFTGQEAN